MMQRSFPKFDYKKAAPTTLEDALQVAYMNCVTSFRVMETSSKGAQGVSVYQTSPSTEEFEQSVMVLYSMLQGVGWFDDQFQKDLAGIQEEEVEEKVQVNTAPSYAHFPEYKTQTVKRTRSLPKKDWDMFDLFAYITALLQRKGFFREKVADLGSV